MPQREKSYEEDYKPTIIDKFGINLSHSKIIKIAKEIKKPVQCLDIGCGYNASLLLSMLHDINEGVGIDVSINSEVKKKSYKLQFIEQSINQALAQLQKKLFNFIVMNSVLEHLEDPLYILKNCYAHLTNKGILVINVPTWLGKGFLEFSAFKLKLSPFCEIDDHKMYYDKRDLWPILIKIGFKPSNITMQYHKFGLNLFCIAIKE